MLIGGIILGLVYAWKIAVVGLGVCMLFVHARPLKQNTFSMHTGYQLGRSRSPGSTSRHA
jgi:hypothetical protein